MAFYFLSYHDRDTDFVEEVLQPELEKSKFGDLVNRYEVEGHPEFEKGVSSAINRADAVILVVSRHAMRSEDVKYEWAYALYINKPIIPVMLETPEIIGRDGKLKVVYEVHEKLARIPWYNFSDEAGYEWSGFKHALVSAVQSSGEPATTVTMNALSIDYKDEI